MQVGSVYSGVTQTAPPKWSLPTQTMTIEPPVDGFSSSLPITTQKIGNITVVRDDLLPGGSKSRFLNSLVGLPYEEFVYASPAYGGAQIALALACQAAGKRATIISPEREEMHDRTLEAQEAGAEIQQRPGGQRDLEQAAEQYAARTGAYLVPHGFKGPDATVALTEAARLLAQTCGPFDEVWAVAGSGSVIKALQTAQLGKSYHAVAVAGPTQIPGVDVVESPLHEEASATEPPPFPSCPTYDAKAWEFVKDRPGNVLFWNVL